MAHQIWACTVQARGAPDKWVDTMRVSNKIAMALLAGVTILTMTAPQAEARNGRNAALLGGLFLGAVAGAALAQNADDNYDEPYRRHDWNRPAPRYEYRSYQRYEPQFSYRRVQPHYSYGYGYGDGSYADGYDHPRRHHWRHYYGGDGYGGYGSDGY
jgi:hypothetical protein